VDDVCPEREAVAMNRPSKYGSSVDYEKPRRLEEETALYLLQLEEQLDAKNEDIEILINNVLDEIKQRVASTFCDKRTNYLLEKICYLSNMRQLIDIMNRCQAYVIFLSQNRYGSHVMQVSLSPPSSSLLSLVSHVMMKGNLLEAVFSLQEQ
jgi:hypothetical protein